jgi:hypothetical protein
MNKKSLGIDLQSWDLSVALGFYLNLLDFFIKKRKLFCASLHPVLVRTRIIASGRVDTLLL